MRRQTAIHLLERCQMFLILTDGIISCHSQIVISYMPCRLKTLAFTLLSFAAVSFCQGYTLNKKEYQRQWCRATITHLYTILSVKLAWIHYLCVYEWRIWWAGVVTSAQCWKQRYICLFAERQEEKSRLEVARSGEKHDTPWETKKKLKNDLLGAEWQHGCNRPSSALSDRENMPSRHVQQSTHVVGYIV